MKISIKKLLALGLIGAVLLSTTACGAKKTNVMESNSSAAGDGTQVASSANEEKINLTLCIGIKNDLSFQQSAYEGAMLVQEKLGDKYNVNVVEMGEDPTKIEAAFYEAADSGADIIVGVGYQDKDIFEKIPLEYPDTKFILMDQDVDYSIGDLSNVLSVLFHSNQSGFLSGAVAAYYTNSDKALNKDKKIGFVGGMEGNVITDFLVGYIEGAKYVDPDTKVLTAYVGNFEDTAKAKDIANAQISEGADILFQVAGGAGTGVIEAASEKQGVMAIGVDSDQYQTLAGTKLQPAVITSSLKRLDNALYKICEDYANNPESVEFGSIVKYGLDTEAVGVVYNDNLTASIGADNVQKIKEIEEKLKAGEIKVDDISELTKEQIDAIIK